MTADRQAPRAAAVVLSTTLGPGLPAAARSVFAQDLGAPIQLLFAVVARAGAVDALDRLRAECPDHVLMTIADPGVPAPGDEAALYGGSGMTPAALAFLANSRYVAFLDDRHRWSADHLAALLRAIDRRSWSASRRHALGPSGVSIAVPPDAVPDADRPNLIMVDKQRHAGALVHWAQPRGMPGPDLLQALRLGGPGGDTGTATVTMAAAADPAPRPAGPGESPSGESSDLAAAVARWRIDMAPARPIAPLRPASFAHLPRLVDAIRPDAAIVLGTEADAVALSLALTAGRLGLSTLVAAIDPFLAAPDDLAQEDRRAALPREDLYPLTLDRLRQAIRRFDLSARLVPVPAEPGPILAALAEAGIRVGLAHAELATDQEDFLLDLDVLWPLIGARGAVFGRIRWPDRIGREMQLRRWAARVGASVSLAPADDGGRATVALRRA